MGIDTLTSFSRIRPSLRQYRTPPGVGRAVPSVSPPSTSIVALALSSATVKTTRINPNTRGMAACVIFVQSGMAEWLRPCPVNLAQRAGGRCGPPACRLESAARWVTWLMWSRWTAGGGRRLVPLVIAASAGGGGTAGRSGVHQNAAISRLQPTAHRARFPDQVGDQTPLTPGLVGIEALAVHAVAVALRRSASRPMEAAHCPARHGGSHTWLPSALGRCRASRAFLKGIVRVHEVASAF